MAADTANHQKTLLKQAVLEGVGDFPQEGFGDSSPTRKTAGVPMSAGQGAAVDGIEAALAVQYLCLRVTLFLKGWRR